MPSPRPIIDARLWIRIESVKYRATSAATPRDRAIDRMPTPTGRIAATTPPKAMRSSRRVSGRTRISAERASAVEAIRRSKFSGASPVQPSHASGWVLRSCREISAVLSRRRGRRVSTGSVPASSPTITRKPDCRPRNSRSLVSSEERVPATPGTPRSAPTILSSAARPSGVPGPGMPSATRRTRYVNGDRKRSSRSARTASAWPLGIRAETSSRSSSRRAAGISSSAPTAQAATIGQR